MRAFRYVRPTDLDEAIAVLNEHGPGARLLSGGTDLIVRLRRGHATPAVVVDLKRVTAIRDDISEGEGLLRIGGRAVMTDVIADRRIQREFPALAEAARVVGSVQIRNRATVAGNISNASPAADTPPALLVYGARVTIAGPSGVREVRLAEFFTGPGRTVLDRGELVVSIDLPRSGDRRGAAFGRVTRRKGVDLATINLCCLIEAGGTVRFAFGAVAPRPILVTDDSGVLGRLDADATARRAALSRLIAAASPISDVRGSRDYRLAMLEVVGERTWKRAVDRLREAGQS